MFSAALFGGLAGVGLLLLWNIGVRLDNIFEELRKIRTALENKPK